MPDEPQNIPPIVEDQTATQQDVPQVEVKIEENVGSASQPTPSVESQTPLPTQTGEPAPMPAHAGATAGQPAIIPEPVESIISRLLAKARQAIKQRKEKKKQKILSALAEKGQLTNKDIRKLIRVSKATATRYMDELEQENQVEQVGMGQKAFYRLKSN